MHCATSPHVIPLFETCGFPPSQPTAFLSDCFHMACIGMKTLQLSWSAGQQFTHSLYRLSAIQVIQCKCDKYLWFPFLCKPVAFQVHIFHFIFLQNPVSFTWHVQKWRPAAAHRSSASPHFYRYYLPDCSLPTVGKATTDDPTGVSATSLAMLLYSYMLYSRLVGLPLLCDSYHQNEVDEFPECFFFSRNRGNRGNSSPPICWPMIP